MEHYGPGWTAAKYHNVMSLTKTIVASLIGIALADGLLGSLDDRVVDYFPDCPDAQRDPVKSTISLRHLLTMRSGFAEPNASGSDHDISQFLAECDPVTRILARPMAAKPGEVYSYDNMNTHLLGHVIGRTSGVSLAEFAWARLFQPLGIWCDEDGTAFPWRTDPDLLDGPHPFGKWPAGPDYPWSIDHSGQQIGSFGLQLTPRHLAAYALMQLRNGRWNNAQIIPSAYVRETIEHGYLRHTAQWAGHTVNFNTGALGQGIATIAGLDAVVVTTGFCTEHNHLREAVEALFDAESPATNE